jgi:hypothetical protein
VQLETAADVRVVLQANHQPRLREGLEDGITSLVIESADFGCVARAELIAGRHCQEKFLELIEASIYPGPTHEVLL